MKIYSHDGRCLIEIVRNLENDWPSFSLIAKVDIGHGDFYAQNQDTSPLNLEDFISELSDFIGDKDVRPTLNFTYNSFITFSKSNSNQILLSFSVCDSFSGYHKPTNFCFSGEFEANPQSMSFYLSEIKRLSEI